MRTVRCTVAAITLSVATHAAVPTQGPAIPTLRDLSGRQIQLDDLRGRVVLIDVWATWCAPCLADLPLLRLLQREHADTLTVIGVSLDRMPRRDFVSWVRRHDVTWPQHFDGRGYASPVAIALGVEALPATVLIATDGSVVARDVRGQSLARLVRALARSARPRTAPASAGAFTR